MTGVYVLSAVAAALIFIFSRKIHIELFYGGELTLKMRYLLLRYSFAAGAKPEKPKKKAAAHQKPSESKPAEKKAARGKPDIKQLIDLLLDTIKKLIKWFGAALYLERFDVRICIAADDAAKTAILYGAVSPLAAEAAQLALKIRHRKCDEKNIRTRCDVDFIGDTPDFFADAAFAVRLWRIFPLLFTAAKAFFKFKNITNHKGD